VLLKIHLNSTVYY